MSELPRKSEYSIDTLTCPDCGNENATLITHTLDIPYYEDYTMVNINCRECGYRTSDFFNALSKGHTIYSYEIDDANDMTTKVVRAIEGTVRIKELGIAIEPISGSSTWVRNIEGILDDINTKLHIALKDFEGDSEYGPTEERIQLLNKMLLNEMVFTIEVDDPTGNSIIIPAVKDKLKITRE